ncbi:MAG: hypothetical protein GY842_01535 [bacterium]|nr:hypothetical protein [bacterium]
MNALMFAIGDTSSCTREAVLMSWKHRPDTWPYDALRAEVRRSSRHVALRRSALILVLLALVVAVSDGDSKAPTEVAGPDGNFVQNAGFETGGTGVPTGWVVDPHARGKGAVARVPSPMTADGSCVKLMPNDSNRERAYPLAIGQGFGIAPFRGQRLRLSGRLSADGDALAVLGLSVIRKDGKILEGVRLTETASPPAGAAHCGYLAVPEEGSAVLLILSCAAEGTGGAAFFDDVYIGIVEASQDGRPDLPSGGPGPSGAKTPLTAEVNIDAGKVIRKIPRTLYGTNVEWIFDGYGLWNAREQAIDRRLVELTRELGTSLIRFPGGVFSDFYRWSDGVGARDDRGSSPHVPGAPESRHNFGTDEALLFASQVGGRLLVTVNAGTGTAGEAAAWVRYVNNERAGGADADRVTYWEVGNELYGRGGAADHVTIPPKKYVERFLRFASAMRVADPGIRIGAIGLENFGRYEMNGYPGWNRVVLSGAGSEMDFLAVHNAYAPMVFEDHGHDVRSVYAAMLAAPVLIAENLKTVSRQIEELVPDRAGDIKIAVTEWGPWFHADPSSRFVDHVKTVGSALFVASTLKTFIESPRTEIANAFKLVDNAFQGWIGLRNGEYIPKAPYLALQLYTQHFGDSLVRSVTKSPEYESAPVGLISRVRNVPYLDVVASLGDDGGSLCVMGINKHFDRSIVATIRITGFAPSPEGQAWVLRGTGIDAHTGTQLPQIPGLEWGRQSAAQPNPRFEQGGPGEVSIRWGRFSGVALSFKYTFPAHSVTALQMRRTE